MKPIAAPVVGGMLSSLAHVLLVTPVIFFWLRARSLSPQSVDEATLPESSRPPFWTWKRLVGAGAVVILLVVIPIVGLWRGAHNRPAVLPTAQVIQQLKSGDLTIAIKSDTGALHQGRNSFTIEFRSATTSHLVDVGEVRLASAMTMPGMAMSGGTEVKRIDVGNYHASGEFGMSGNWRFSLEWTGPTGSGSVSFNGDVR